MKTRQKIGECMFLMSIVLAVGFVLWLIEAMIRINWQAVIFGTLGGLAFWGLLMGGLYLIDTGADKEAK